jgi:hypothetical protein
VKGEIMNKIELKENQIIKVRRGAYARFVNGKEFVDTSLNITSLEDFTMDLRHKYMKELDIVAVYEANEITDGLEIIWERKK